MSEEFAIEYAKRRARERGYPEYRLVYREFILPAGGRLRLTGYNEIWLVLYIAWGLIVESDYGRYQNWYVEGNVSNTHEHADQIEIINTRKYQRRIRFLQVILKTKTDGDTK